MNRYYNSLYFGGFAAITWWLISIPWMHRLGTDFIGVAALCAAITAAVITIFVPVEWFKHRKMVGMFKALGGSAAISLSTVFFSIALFYLVSGIRSSVMFGGDPIIGDAAMVLITLAIFPPALIFWLVASAGLWWLHTRSHRH